MLPQRVHRADVLEEEAPDVLDRHPGPVEVDILGRIAAIVGPHADEVALVADDVDQLVALEGALDGRVALAALLPRLDRHRHVLVTEAEAQEHVRDHRAHPVGGDEVERVEPSEVEGAVVVGRREVRLRAVIEVPDVVERDQIAGNGGIRQPRDLRRPVPVVRRRDRAPVEQEPGERQGKGGQEGCPPAPGRDRAKRSQGEKPERRRGGAPQPAGREPGVV